MKLQIGHSGDFTGDEKDAMVCLCSVEEAITEDELEDDLLAHLAEKR